MQVGLWTHPGSYLYVDGPFTSVTCPEHGTTPRANLYALNFVPITLPVCLYGIMQNWGSNPLTFTYFLVSSRKWWCCIIRWFVKFDAGDHVNVFKMISILHIIRLFQNYRHGWWATSTWSLRNLREILETSQNFPYNYSSSLFLHVHTDCNVLQSIKVREQ